jgi:hypothetical protein
MKTNLLPLDHGELRRYYQLPTVAAALGSGYYHLKAWGDGTTTLCCNVLKGSGARAGTIPCSDRSGLFEFLGIKEVQPWAEH